MDFKNIILKKANGVAEVILNRPDKLNALNFDMLDEIWSALQDILHDNEVNVILLSGAGRYFSSGADLEILSSLSSATFHLHQHKYWNRVFCELENIHKLTIAAINGPAIGGGVELSLCCDLRYSADSAEFRMPQIDFGILPDAGATIRLPRLIGLAPAKEFILSGRKMNAEEALQKGLLNGVFPDELFENEIKKIATAMAEKPGKALSMGKKLINRGFQQSDVKTGLEEITDIQSMLISTDDFRNRINKFMKKRPQN